MQKAVLILSFLFSSYVFAQKVDLKDLNADESTTIEISKGNKGKNSTKEKCEALWEVQEGNTEISGESAIMIKDAEKNMKQACTDWEKRFRADNKENRIIDITCVKKSCDNEASGKICVANAKYKIKTRMD